MPSRPSNTWKFVVSTLLSLMVGMWCVPEVFAVRVSLPFRGVVDRAFNAETGEEPAEGVTSGMMVEGEVWWDNAEPVQSFRQICAAGTPPNCLGGSTSVYVWSTPTARYGFGIRVGEHVMTSDPWNLQMTVVDMPSESSIQGGFDWIRLEYTGHGRNCSNTPATSPTSCQFIFDLYLDPSTLTSSAIPNSPLILGHPLPITRGIAIWDINRLELIFQISEGGILVGAPEAGTPQEPIMPINPGTPGWEFPLSAVGFLRVVIMPIFLPSCMSWSLRPPEASRGLGQRQLRQGWGCLLWHRDRRPGCGDEAAQGQRCLVKQGDQEQVQPRRKTLTSRRRVARRVRGCPGTRAVTSGTG